MKLDNEVLEGPCDYNSCDYDFHEYGVDEEGIEILHHLIYKSSIKSIEEIDDYSSDYGTLEDVNFETYLLKAYNRYCLSKKDYIIQIVMILNKTCAKRKLSRDTKIIVGSLLETYSDLIR